MRKFICTAAALLAASMIFAGCSAVGTPSETTGVTDTRVITDASAESEKITESTESTDNREEIPEGPVDIETSGTAIVIGIIGRDDDGWFFTPEQTVNLRLTYYGEDNAEVFDGVTKFRMLGTDGDGIRKVEYEGMTVTVSGLITNPRSAGILYLIPYKVEFGRTADGSCAAPDLQPPAYLPENGGYDADALPAEMAPNTENGVYSYNFFALSEEALNKYGNVFADMYVDFVKAYLNYETEIVCPTTPASDGYGTDIHYGDFIQSVVYYEFPVFAADAEFSDYDIETKTLTWKYKVGKAEHDSTVEEFKTLAESYMNNVKPSDSDAVKAQKVYHNFSPKMTYDFDVLETRVHSEPYYAFKLNRGICTTFAKAYAVLLTQVGVKCSIVGGEYTTGPHAWVVFTADGENYFADPTFELSINNGMSYVYFGESYERRINDGFDENSVYIGRYDAADGRSYGISDHDIRIAQID